MLQRLGGAMTGSQTQDLQTHAVVTGAAQGIGAAIAIGLADAGHVVTVLDVKDATLIRCSGSTSRAPSGRSKRRCRTCVGAAAAVLCAWGRSLGAMVACCPVRT